MSYGDLQFFDIIIFAAIAVFLVFRLKNVLGKRTGFQGAQNQESLMKEESLDNAQKTEKEIPELEENVSKLKKAYEVFDSFDHNKFLDGAKNAFETIINAFNKGDKGTLKNLLTTNVYKIFEKEINNNNFDKDIQIFSLNIEKIEEVKVNKEKITIKIKFISEQFKNNDESTKVKKEDIWAFEKDVGSKNPNWLLCST